jgi:hypothetical protein
MSGGSWGRSRRAAWAARGSGPEHTAPCSDQRRKRGRGAMAAGHAAAMQPDGPLERLRAQWSDTAGQLQRHGARRSGQQPPDAAAGGGAGRRRGGSQGFSAGFCCREGLSRRPPTRHASKPTPVCRPEQEQEEARPRERRPWPYRQAPQAPGRPRYGRWPAPPQDSHGQVPPWLLRKGGNTWTCRRALRGGRCRAPPYAAVYWRGACRQVPRRAAACLCTNSCSNTKLCMRACLPP